MKKRLFPLIIALSALSVAGSAAFYSVFGLSKLFAGAATQVIIMAGSLEFAKLVVASLLYQYWDTINKILKGYLMVACFVLMVITSGGIYGFLSGAYQSTATQSELLDKSLVILEQKQVRFEETKEDLTLEKTQINKSISDLRVSLSNPHSVSWFDKNSQTVITSSSSSARRALQAELKTTITDRDNINLKLDAILDSITTTDMALLNKEISNENERELGPLKYLSKTTGRPMDEVVNWFLLLIIFVFDPLAIALVVAANMAFAQIRKPKEKDDTEEYFQNRNKKLEKVAMSVPKGMEFNKPYPMEFLDEELKKRITENQEKLKEEKREETNEDYFTDLEQYIKYTKEEIEPEGLIYPAFVEKHHQPTTSINTYGDDDWATPNKEEVITLDGGEIEVTVEPTEEQMKHLVIHESDLDEDITVTSTTETEEKDEYIGELERLTDTTQTLIVEELEDNSEEIIEDEEPNKKPTKVLRYTKNR